MLVVKEDVVAKQTNALEEIAGDSICHYTRHTATLCVGGQPKFVYPVPGNAPRWRMTSIQRIGMKPNHWFLLASPLHLP